MEESPGGRKRGKTILTYMARQSIQTDNDHTVMTTGGPL